MGEKLKCSRIGWSHFLSQKRVKQKRSWTLAVPSCLPSFGYRFDKCWGKKNKDCEASCLKRSRIGIAIQWMPEDCGGLGSGSEWVLVAVYAGYSHGCRGAKSKEGWPTTLILSVKWSSTKYVVINKALNNDEVFYFLSVKKKTSQPHWLRKSQVWKNQ